MLSLLLRFAFEYPMVKITAAISMAVKCSTVKNRIIPVFFANITEVHFGTEV